MPSPLADPAGFKIPVPPLPLDRLLAGKGACDVIQPLTGGSDVSSRSRLPLSAHTTPASPVAGSSGPAAGLPLGNLRSDDDPGSPNSAIDCSTPRTDLNMATLTLHSPPSAAYKTPKRTPRMSPHSPHSPSMMSPLRLVGTRSPCSRRIVGSQRITGDKVVPIRNEGQSDRATGGVLQRGPGAVSKPPVQRALPFSPQRPTRGANAPSKAPVGDFERFITPHQGQSRELSFSDLLSGPGRAHVSPRLRSLSPVGLTPAPPAAPEHHHHHLLPRELSNADSAVSPRKRPRKSTAPQRSGFGSGDSFSYDDAVAQPMAPRSGQGETCGSACLDDGAPAHTSPVRRSGRK